MSGTWSDRLSRLDDEAFIMVSETHRTASESMDDHSHDLLLEAEVRLSKGYTVAQRVDTLTIEEVQAGLYKGKIPCIQLFRARVGIGLANSKEAVENFFDAAGLKFHSMP